MASVRSDTSRLFVLLIVAIPACTGLPGGGVFVSRPEASVFLHRARRANYLFEELRRSNVERECYEEKCSYEEAKEIYALPQQLEAFWRRYTAVDHCQSSPCKNGASCTRHLDSYSCKCPPKFHGHHCNKDTVACGRPQLFFSPRVINGNNCPKGQCPWQALLTEHNVFICGAIVLSNRWVLTAAHCVWRKPAHVFNVTVGEHDLNVEERTEQRRRVVKVVIHRAYNKSSSDSDMALLKLQRPVKLGPHVVPVCLPARNSSFSRTLASVRVSTVSGWGRVAQRGPAAGVLQRLVLPRVPLQECRLHSNLTITKNMLCAGLKAGGSDACEGDSGGPLVTRYKKTWFLTGVVSWGKGCANRNLYGVYSRVSNFLGWIESVMAHY
ncbi:coagulation factor VII isoform X2 [Pseudochaenichthys georgianus]|uniref:coagulation factor VII isoform X2 n=1 Tax=Pseudochaenichthys georgianus TaxID=52239 RepID=UPI00146BC2E7|nr:coagulation factor VII isoform X2 [Pseudochaenichthys georgianus]